MPSRPSARSGEGPLPHPPQRELTHGTINHNTHTVVITSATPAIPLPAAPSQTGQALITGASPTTLPASSTPTPSVSPTPPSATPAQAAPSTDASLTSPSLPVPPAAPSREYGSPISSPLRRTAAASPTPPAIYTASSTITSTTKNIGEGNLTNNQHPHYRCHQRHHHQLHHPPSAPAANDANTTP